METPGNGPPRPVIVPLIVHVAAVGLPAVASAEVSGACCAPSAVPAITIAIAAPLTVVDIVSDSPALRRGSWQRTRFGAPRQRQNDVQGLNGRLFTFFTCI